MYIHADKYDYKKPSHAKKKTHSKTFTYYYCTQKIQIKERQMKYVIEQPSLEINTNERRGEHLFRMMVECLGLSAI